MQSFNRDQEREADYYAIETLNKLQLSSEPLVKYLNLLEKKSIQGGMLDEYYKFSSHPIYEERYNIITNIKTKKKNNFNEKLNIRLKFIQAKIFGFTTNNKSEVNEYLDKDYQIYAKSIILSRESKLKESLKLLNNFINKNPNNYFLYETKGDILYAGGYLEESILFYNKSNKKNQSNNYVKKKVFDIKFSLIKKNNIKDSLKLFQEYIFLLELYYNNNDLKNKYKKLAIITKKFYWIEYFTTEERYFNKEIERGDFIQKINLIKNKTKDLNLINLINKHINN
jgi:predicted Zn-dependent protease